MGWLAGIPDSVDMSLSRLLGDGNEWEAWCAAVHSGCKIRYDLVTEQQQSGKVPLSSWNFMTDCLRKRSSHNIENKWFGR